MQELDTREQHSLFYFIFDAKIPYDIKEGYRTDEIPTAIRLFEEFVTTNSHDVDTLRKSWNQIRDYIVGWYLAFDEQGYVTK
jgi:hypothetical protein